MVFQPKMTDFEKSPYTGLTRESFIEAGKYLLQGIFVNIKSFDDPVIVAPLIHNVPELTVCGYNMRDYYKKQVLRVCTKGDTCYVGNYRDLQELSGHKDAFQCFQQTVETCALVIGLWMCKGWSDIQYVSSTGTNPDSEKSIVVYAVTKREKQYGGYEPHLLISQVITKESLEDFKDEELFAVKSVAYADEAGAGNYGTTVLTMCDGSKKEINFEEMEAHLVL